MHEPGAAPQEGLEDGGVVAQEGVGVEVGLHEEPRRRRPPLVLRPLLARHRHLHHVDALLRQLHHRPPAHLHARDRPL